MPLLPLLPPHRFQPRRQHLSSPLRPRSCARALSRAQLCQICRRSRKTCSLRATTASEAVATMAAAEAVVDIIVIAATITTASIISSVTSSTEAITSAAVAVERRSARAASTRTTAAVVVAVAAVAIADRTTSESNRHRQSRRSHLLVRQSRSPRLKRLLLWRLRLLLPLLFPISGAMPSRSKPLRLLHLPLPPLLPPPTAATTAAATSVRWS